MSFADWLSQTYPQVRVTSGQRDPNSRLGRANPRSWHNVGKAWDTAPIPGVSFDQYRDRVSKDWNVLEARDEVANPSAHATGPHWHMAVGDRKEAKKVAGLGDMIGQTLQPQQIGLAELMGQQIMPGDQPGPQMQDPSIKKPGAFSKDGNGWKILGVIGDALQTAGGGRATYAPMLQEQQLEEKRGQSLLQQIMAKAEQAKAQAQQERADYLWKQQNQGPTGMARDLQTWQGMTPEQRQQYAQMKDVQTPIAVSGPQGTFRVPRGYGQAATTKQLPNGQTAYFVNGDWYDNPEGQ